MRLEYTNEEEKQLRKEQEALGITTNVVNETESMGDLELVKDMPVETNTKTHLEISTSEEGYISEEDLDDASIFFDFFDGEVDV